ncbi:unnamed protein product [Sphenostylis stenocarpa]|uniref:Uncharacterized protein n=1 Tax=Sphenostylis stenocarpa TaxID=92480 RepID=A0AA86VUJ5_9FABA|nr:unnamed protein product [Sphenostylis stenocarpa]
MVDLMAAADPVVLRGVVKFAVNLSHEELHSYLFSQVAPSHEKETDSEKRPCVGKRSVSISASVTEDNHE